MQYLTLGIVPRITSQLLNPSQLAEWFPDVEAFQDPDNFFFQFLAGISSGLVYTIFFSFLPQIFKAMAFYKGNASSVAVAEDNALDYYWVFMLLTAFTGSSLANMLFSLFSGEKLRIYHCARFKNAAVILIRIGPRLVCKYIRC